LQEATMNLNETYRDVQVMRDAENPTETETFLDAVECILDDCFFAVGQVVGMRKTVDYDAVLWWRDHYRAKFLRAMDAFGNRWATDRDNVTGVAMLFGERAVRYAGDADSINLEAFKQAAADVERYCHIHSTRKNRPSKSDNVERPLMAGYWCTL
jgi:hypothetical protein